MSLRRMLPAPRMPKAGFAGTAVGQRMAFVPRAFNRCSLRDWGVGWRAGFWPKAKFSTGSFAGLPLEMRKLKLRLLTWDVKDTLLRLRHPVGHSYAAEAEARGLRVPAEVLSAAFRQAYVAQSQHFPNYGVRSGLTSHQWWTEVATETFRLAGVTDEGLLRPLVEKLYQDYSTAQNWELLPGAWETLQRCQALDIPMGVVSNFDRRLRDVLSSWDLHRHFRFILSSEEVGFAKPDKWIFLEALRISGVAPQEAAHVGDHYVKDYRAAREVGMHSFLFKAPEQPLQEGEEGVPKGHILTSLPHLLSLVEQG